MFTELLEYFETIPTWHRTLFLAIGLVAFWAIEGLMPLFRFEYERLRHALINLFFWVTTLLMNLAFASAIITVSISSNNQEWGLLNVVDLPLVVQVVGGLLMLDFIGAWLIHWLEHQVGWMWRFHLIHHTDREVDVTTGLRHHPGEAVFRASFTLLAVAVSGASVGTIFLYQSLSALFAQLTHANVSSPEKVDRVLSWIFVTPNMHKVHHHYTRPLTDTNYGNIFSIWDRMFGTFAEVEVDDIVYGLDRFLQTDSEERISDLLKLPFNQERQAR